MSLSFRAFADARGFGQSNFFPTISLRAVNAFVFPSAPENPVSLETLLESGGPIHVIGFLNISVSPAVLTIGEQLQVVVTATDPQTGATINGLNVKLATEFFASAATLPNVSLGPDGPFTSGVTGSPFAYTPTGSGTLVVVYGAPSYLNTTIQVDFTPQPVPPPPPPPAPRISTSIGQNGEIIVKGTSFPSASCEISRGDGWGFIEGGPWTGNIVTGIALTSTPCDDPGGDQSYGINILSDGRTYSFTIYC